MIKNQFSRRNLSIEVRLALAYQFKEFEAEKAKARQGTRHDLVKENFNISLPVGLSCTESIKTNDNDSKGKTLEIIAQIASVSRATAEQYDAIQRKGVSEQGGITDSKPVYTLDEETKDR